MNVVRGRYMRMKKIISFILVLLICSNFCCFSSAAQIEEEIFLEEQTGCIPEEVISDFEENIRRAEMLEDSSVSEFEIYKKAENMSISELVDAGYSLEVANKIKNGELEETILQAVFERASLPEDTLSNMGYTREEIRKMKSLTGEETLSEIEALDVSAEVTCYNYLRSHYYKKQENKTYFIVSFGWQWSKTPIMLLTDCVGLGWNHDFHPENLSSSYNKHYITYLNKNDALDTQSLTQNLVEKNLQTSESIVDVQILHGLKYYWAKSGTGDMCLSQIGKASNVKFTMKYGHNEMGIAPSVGYPWSISFSLTEAESIFQPPELEYSAAPTEV